jgi:pyruvate oxidase
MVKWRCRVCGYIYVGERGDETAGITPGTAFTDLPENWRCPVCGAPKDGFIQEPEEDIHAGASTTVSDVLIAELAAWGVTVIFGIPGTSSLGLVDAIRKNSAVQYIVIRHEENAAMAASAYYKLTGRMAACLTIAGPGATNLATGLYDAKEDHASVLSINGQVEVQYTGPGEVQEIDQDAFFRPIAIFNNTIANKETAVLLLTRALKTAVLGRGVAQISVPNDIQKEPLDSQFCSRESCITGFDIMTSDPSLIRAADAINRARNPVILAGWGAFESAAEVRQMAEKIKAPILTTFRAKGLLPAEDAWLVGVLGSVGSPQARSLAENSDLLIVLGVGFSKLTNVPKKKPMVQVDIDPIKLGKNPQALSLWGNCIHVLPRLLPLLQERPGDRVRKEIAAMKKEWQDQLDREADSRQTPLRPPFIMKVLSEVIPEDAIISLDVGENQWWFGRNFQIKRQRFAMSGYLGTMGFGFPGAIAAKIAYPEKSVFCITGDGGFSMAMSDFVTAVKYSLPMVVVILNNRQLGMIQVEQMTERYPNYATELLNPDFAKYAEVCGGQG